MRKMKKQILYGMLGFLSLLGFVGVFTEARGFLGFFAFAVDFQYFFLKSDEMLAEQLARLKKDVTIITNSAYIAIRIRELPIRKVILLGGEYQKEYQGMVGPLVRKCAREFFVDKFFVGTDGFIPDAGFTCDDLMRVETMQYMESSANRTIILADSSKFSQKGVVVQSTFSEIDTVCTDSGIPQEIVDILNRNNIHVEIAD